MKKWLKYSGKGALWLVFATLLTKLIGVLQKIPLQNIGGDEVFGIYNLLYPLYQLLLILAVSGIPTAISIIIASEPSQNRTLILKASHTLMLMLGLIFGVLLFILSNPLALILGNSDLTNMIKIFALNICLAPWLASFRGYYQGVQLASYSSLSQLIEQIIRVMVMVTLLFVGVNQQWDATHIATQVMWGGVAGAIVALIYFLFIGQEKLKQLKPAKKRENSLYKYYIRLLLFAGLPTALTSLIVPLTSLIDTFTVPMLLNDTVGFNEMAEQFGLYSRIQPLVQLVTMLLVAVVAGSLPQLLSSGKEHEGGSKLNSHTVFLILKYTILVGGAASLGLYLLAEPILIMLYEDSKGLLWFQQLAWMTLPASLLMVCSPLLLVRGKLKALLFLLSLSVLIKLGLNVIQISNEVSLQGAITSTLATLYIIAMVAFILIIRTEKDKPSFTKTMMSLLLGYGLMTITIIGIRWSSEYALGLTFTYRSVVSMYVISLVLVGAGVLLLVLKQCKVIEKKEIRQLLK